MENIGKHLKRIRYERKLSLIDVYKATGITDSRLCRIENSDGIVNIMPTDLKKLAAVYQIDLVELYIIAGYLDESSFSSYQRIFRNADLLTQEEKSSIQTQIDLFTKGRKRNDL